VIAASTGEGLAMETVSLAVDAGLSCPAVLVHRAAPGTEKQAAVVFSHDGRLSAEAPEVQAAVRQLATQGYWVLVPDHVSIHPKSRRKLELADVPGFFAAADLAGLPPLALRVAEDLAAFRYLAGRAEVDPARILTGGSGIGAIDACLSAVLEARIAGVAAVNVTTFRDWAENVAPEETVFLHTLPYLPGILAVTDLDYCIAAIAPRPLVFARLKEGWPKSGFEQVAATAAAAYRLAGAEKALVAVGLRDPIDERIARLPEGLQKQTAAVARAILPAPAVPGVVGTREGLRSREVIDSATGIVWVFSAVGGEEQEFCDGGYRLDSWSFYNGKGEAQRGSAITPLIFKKAGDAYKLTGIGKTRVNAGTGLQTFPFDVAQGSDQVGAGHFFGFYTGDPAGKPNAGVVEYNDDYQDRMIILTLDGAMVDQKIAIGQNFRENSRWPRAYSIQAVSKRK
jgi:dienelactone hydrolase